MSPSLCSWEHGAHQRFLFFFFEGIGSAHSVGLPVHVYPLYENGFRAHRGQSIADNNKESARLYAEFAKVAENHPAAWSYGKPAETEETIGAVTKTNRMICFPCEFPAFHFWHHPRPLILRRQTLC